jgi:phosphoglycerate dehydrogenase-like enzyme
MQQLKVLLLPIRKPPISSPWCDDVIAAVDDHHELKVLDPETSLADQFGDVDVVIDHGGKMATREMMDAAVKARLWQIIGTGFETFDLNHIRGLGIPLANCPGPCSSVALAETAMMYMLMLAGHYRQRAANFREGRMYVPVGRELDGAHLVILGFGASGQALARRARAFGMEVSGIDVRRIDQSILDDIRPDFMGTPDDLDGRISTCDYLSLHLHVNDATRHIIDERRLGLMPGSACLINIARGELVDQEALFRALEAGRLGGAGLDVFAPEPADPDHPVFSLPTVVATPHTAGTTYGTSRRRAQCIAENVNRVAKGLEPLYRVDL